MDDFSMKLIVVVIIAFLIIITISGLIGSGGSNTNYKLFPSILTSKVKISDYESSVLKELMALPSVQNFDACADCRYFAAYEEDSKFIEDTIEFDIAGVNMRPNKIGAFLGMIIAEPSNEYDRNAIAIYNLDLKLLGYIPKRETALIRKEYDEFGDGRCTRFIYGYIRGFTDDEEKIKLYGKIFMPTKINPFWKITDVKKAEKYIAEFSDILDKLN